MSGAISPPSRPQQVKIYVSRGSGEQNPIWPQWHRFVTQETWKNPTHKIWQNLLTKNVYCMPTKTPPQTEKQKRSSMYDLLTRSLYCWKASGGIVEKHLWWVWNRSNSQKWLRTQKSHSNSRTVTAQSSFKNNPNHNPHYQNPSHAKVIILIPYLNNLLKSHCEIGPKSQKWLKLQSYSKILCWDWKKILHVLVAKIGTFPLFEIPPI